MKQLFEKVKTIVENKNKCLLCGNNALLNENELCPKCQRESEDVVGD